jgi:hypothetical protein
MNCLLETILAECIGGPLHRQVVEIVADDGMLVIERYLFRGSYTLRDGVLVWVPRKMG